jgi:hypothetical protein
MLSLKEELLLGRANIQLVLSLSSLSFLLLLQMLMHQVRPSSSLSCIQWNYTKKNEGRRQKSQFIIEQRRKTVDF